MTSVRSPASKTAFLLSILLLSLLVCSSSSATNPVRIDDFKEGVPFTERMRLKVKDIVIGKESVKQLFKDIEQKEPSWIEYYSGKTNTLTLIIKDSASLEELRVILAAQGVDGLKVILQDDRDTFLRTIFPGRFNSAIDIPIIMTPCEEMTRIIYTRINSIVKEQVQKEGETDKRINLDQVFDMLLHDEIEPYIANLDVTKKDDPCINTFQLLKWLRGEQAPGFDLGEYNINEGLRGLLQPVTDALVDIQSSGALYNLDVKIVGYTDPVPVRTDKIDLQLNKTGVDDWSKIEKPLDISYSGCSNDNLDGKNPVYIDFTNSGREHIKQKISNNCELGAVRAYVAMIYLMNKLGQKGVEYKYATGGIYPGYDNNKIKDSRKRKVSIELIIKTAKGNK